jgi:hypothetical protein
MKRYFFDYEVYPNCLLGVFIDVDTPQEYIDEYVNADINDDDIRMGEAMEKINPQIFITMYDDERVVDQLDEMLLFIDSPDVMVIGYNNNLYDDIISNYCIIKKRRLGQQISTVKILELIYNVNDTIINGAYQTILYDSLFKGYKARYYSMDCLSSLYETIHRKSLKQTMINLKWYNVLDLPIAPGTHITWDMLSRLTYYCCNDVLGTRAFYFYNIKEVNMKYRATMLYGIMLVNKNRSSIADALLQKMYRERTGLTYWQIKDLRTFRTKIKLSDIIDPRIHFDVPIFQEYLDRLKSSIMIAGDSKLLNAKLPFMGNKYDFAKGGLHSKDQTGLYASNEKYAIMDGDADSYYPRSVINDKVCPAHLFQPVFTSIGEYLTNNRLEAKHLKDTKPDATVIELENAKTIADVLKIVINSGIFGKFGYEKGWLYDLQCLYQVTINNQLRLLKWIEMLELKHFQVLSVNTDGVTAKVERSRMDEYIALSNEWGSMFGITLEYNEYKLYVRLNVNSYFAVYAKTGKIKEKGRFLRNIAIEKGYDKPIVAKALIEYFMNGTNIDTFLRQHTDIYDFCISQKLGAEYSPTFHELVNSEKQITDLQKNIRYYVQKTGGRIMKVKGSKEISVLKEQVVLFNKFIKHDNIEDYDIDYSYYRREIMKLVNDIEHTSTKIMKKVSGNMFDDIE